MSAAVTLWNKQMMKSLRNSEEMIGMLIQPVLWVVLFGIGMGKRTAKDTRMELEYMFYSSSDVDNTHMIVFRYIFDGTPPSTGFK